MAEENHCPIAVTPGEPAGIGPDVLIQLLSQSQNHPIIVIGDPNLLHDRSKKLGLIWPESIPIFPVKMAVLSKAGEADVRNVPYVLNTLKIAHEGCMSGKFRALVTGPVHKGLINEAGIPFEGHTQFLAKLAQSKTLMLFVTPKMKVALATTHIPLQKVSEKIESKLITQCVELMHQGLEQYFSIKNPRITVLGLNPHAGENGHMGTEELEKIIPCLNALREKNYSLIGPIPADTAFTENNLSASDGILAMYHDQALPVIKALDFAHAVNVTLGLPYIRTSVDHGTAFELAGTGKADYRSFQSALELCYSLSSRALLSQETRGRNN